MGVGELGLSTTELYNLTWKEFSLKCQGLTMKYQRLAVHIRQLAAVIVNSQPGREEPVKPEEIYTTAFDELKEPAKVPDYSPEQWEAEQQRLLKHFETVNNGKS